MSYISFFDTTRAASRIYSEREVMGQRRNSTRPGLLSAMDAMWTRIARDIRSFGR